MHTAVPEDGVVKLHDTYVAPGLVSRFLVHKSFPNSTTCPRTCVLRRPQAASELFSFRTPHKLCVYHGHDTVPERSTCPRALPIKGSKHPCFLGSTQQHETARYIQQTF